MAPVTVTYCQARTPAALGAQRGSMPRARPRSTSKPDPGWASSRGRPPSWSSRCRSWSWTSPPDEAVAATPPAPHAAVTAGSPRLMRPAARPAPAVARAARCPAASRSGCRASGAAGLTSHGGQRPLPPGLPGGQEPARQRRDPLSHARRHTSQLEVYAADVVTLFGGA